MDSPDLRIAVPNRPGRFNPGFPPRALVDPRPAIALGWVGRWEQGVLSEGKELPSPKNSPISETGRVKPVQRVKIRV